MNYYDLQEFTGLKISQLLESFKSEKTIRFGSISVFEDSIGKPGDRILELRKIEIKEDDLHLYFNENEKIIINKPNHVVINEKVIGIQKCKEINWINKDLNLVYSMDSNNSKIQTKVITGEHNFRVNNNSAAFLFYSW